MFQAMEIFPTCVRQSGIGLCSFISQMISIGGPYAIATGYIDARYPYIVMFLICLVGTVSVSFLPETVGAKLPETLEEANNINKSLMVLGEQINKDKLPIKERKNGQIYHRGNF